MARRLGICTAAVGKAAIRGAKSPAEMDIVSQVVEALIRKRRILVQGDGGGGPSFINDFDFFFGATGCLEKGRTLGKTFP